jgi:hypothetical protein
MRELEDKIRDALRRQAEQVDEPPAQSQRPSVGARVTAAVVSAAFVAAVVAAAIWIERSPDLLDPATSPSPTASPHAPSVAESCPPASVAVSFLPWLETGTPIPEPETSLDGRNSVSVWFEDLDARWDGAYAALTTSEKSLIGEDLVEFPSTSVLGQPAHLVWIGDPGVGELALVWNESTGDCMWRTLSLSTAGLTQKQAESALLKIAASLE